MRVFVDTSAWVKYFIEEEGTPEMQDFMLKISLAENIRVSASAVTYAEMHATFRRALRGMRITEEQYNLAVQDFNDQWEMVDIPDVNARLIRQSGRLAQEHVLRGGDAFQLASALEVEAEVFVCADDDLQQAAQESGLSTWNPVQGPFSMPLGEEEIFEAEDEASENEE
jgi:predicted nucleic acid-binding protein